MEQSGVKLTKAQRRILRELSATSRVAERRGDEGYFMGFDSAPTLGCARRLKAMGLAEEGRGVSRIFRITPAGLAALSTENDDGR